MRGLPGRSSVSRSVYAIAMPDSQQKPPFIHSHALVESDNIGPGTRIWAFAHVMPGAVIGSGCNICDHTYIDEDVVIGDRVTIKAGVYVIDGMRVEDDVFIGPLASFTNDRFPRSRQPFQCETIVIGKGASIGAGAVFLPGVSVGEGAMVGAGAVVTKDVPPFMVVVGNPARVVRAVTDAERVPERPSTMAMRNGAAPSFET
jgi:UDP-2-acetamido-3-amino-2,3-dideoxy-glucuronate N-acetyltransferase